MPTRIKLKQERLLIDRMLIRILTHEQPVVNDVEIGVVDVLLCCAVAVGQLEGRPMKVGKLAQYLGMPRPTVFRKVKELEKAGAFTVEDDGVVTTPLSVMNCPRRLECIRRAVAEVKRTACELSKLDT